MKLIFVMLSIAFGFVLFKITKNSEMIDLINKDRDLMLSINESNIIFTKKALIELEPKNNEIKNLKMQLEAIQNEKIQKFNISQLKKLIKDRNKKYGIGENLWFGKCSCYLFLYW